MKMRLYYVVKRLEKSEYQDMDCRMMAGPFVTRDEAYDAKQNVVQNNYHLYGDYEIVEQIVELQNDSYYPE